MLPNLSDDFYRFIWDGRLLVNGENPYLHLPSYYIENNIDLTGVDRDLFSRMNSPDYFSIYPPVCQFVFFIACKLFPESLLGSVIVIRSFILLGESGVIFLLDKLVRLFKLSRNSVLIYALNPLVIIELTGNLHFEAIMIFFLLLSVFLLLKSSPLISASAFALAVGTKLIPLMFLPFLLKRLGFQKTFFYYSAVAFVLLLIFSPFINGELISNLFSSLSLYFQKFEFNAGVYYLIRWIGYEIKGYNIIATSGIALAAAVTISIVIIMLLDKGDKFMSLPQTMLWAVTCYYVFATTVHPWYIAPLIALSVLSPYRYAVIWSGLIPLTYFTYRTIPYRENLGLVAFEYLVVGAWLIYEVVLRRTKNLRSV